MIDKFTTDATATYTARRMVSLILVTGMLFTGCSSPAEDADARGEIETPTTAQDVVIAEAENQAEANAETHAAVVDETVTTTPAAEDLSAEDIATINNQQIGTHDNAELADGTDIEEHVSSY